MLEILTSNFIVYNDRILYIYNDGKYVLPKSDEYVYILEDNIDLAPYVSEFMHSQILELNKLNEKTSLELTLLLS